MKGFRQFTNNSVIGLHVTMLLPMREGKCPRYEVVKANIAFGLGSP